MTDTTTQQSIPNGVWTKLLSGPVSVYQDSGANSWVEGSGDHLTLAPLAGGGRWRVRVGDLPSRVVVGVYLEATNQSWWRKGTLTVDGRDYEVPPKQTRVVGPVAPDASWSASGVMVVSKDFSVPGEFGEDLP